MAKAICSGTRRRDAPVPYAGTPSELALGRSGFDKLLRAAIGWRTDDGINFFRYALDRCSGQSCPLMSLFKLANEHPLTKAGLHCVYIVETAELGLRLGDIVFEFPFGRIVDTGMACRRHGIIPPGVDIETIHKETTAVRAACNAQGREVKPTLLKKPFGVDALIDCL